MLDDTLYHQTSTFDFIGAASKAHDTVNKGLSVCAAFFLVQSGELRADFVTKVFRFEAAYV